ncbi:MAG TPA: ribonuclease Z [Nitrospiraceae bacterium]|nr:ribonuclease Z [Nitrospiraceae bacterium]
MKPLLNSFLINSPFEDPGLYIEIKWEKRSILFDLGDISLLEPAKLVKVSDVFISHTHMDHFVGFDYLLRLILRREKGLRLFGPPGITDNIEGKLGGYTWNLTEGYPFTIHVVEVYRDKIRMADFSAKDGFKRHDISTYPFRGSILEDEMFTVFTSHLDHMIPSLGFALKERFHININKDKLNAMNLTVGPWLRRFKQALWDGKPEDEIFTIGPEEVGISTAREFSLGELKDSIATISEGQKISYIVDAIYSPENEEKIILLAKDSDVMYCEAAYLDKDTDLASERYHLTARQAGEIARKACAKDLVIFHFSPRYIDDPAPLYEEAMKAFRGT